MMPFKVTEWRRNGVWADLIGINNVAAVERMDKQDKYGGDGDLFVGLHYGGSRRGRKRPG